MLVFKILLVILLADFFTGFVHFVLDQYGNPEKKILQNAVLINLAHHANPRKMVSRGYWYLTKDSYKIGAVIFLISLIFGFHWEILLFVLIGANTNIIHKWSHQTSRENPWLVRMLQKLYILQTRKQHGYHHRRPYETHFCILTNLLNPILEIIRFWPFLISVFSFFGLDPVDRSGAFFENFEM